MSAGDHAGSTVAEPIGMPAPIAASGAAAGGTAAVAVSVLGLEVVQSVQDLQNSVRLVAGKAAIVRVYVKPIGPLPQLVLLTGEIVWQRGLASPPAYLPSMNTVRLQGATAPLSQMRQDMALSLNFRLPDEAVAAGPLQIRLNRIMQLGAGDAPLQPAPGPVSVRFDAGAPLRVRVIGLRYLDQTQTSRSPDAVHFQFVRSWLGRAYPTSRVEWSQIVVDADFGVPFQETTAQSLGTAGLANAQIAALRAADVSAGTDLRTHYYGLVADAGGLHFMRGLAFTIPGAADPSVVASGPAGVPNGFAGDRDRSYADWYTGHELGHTFGRYHPGFPQGAQDASDPHFPYPDGQISTDDERFVGLDLGDPALGLTMQALPGRTWHDVMTYSDNQWVSAYTYEAIYQRLLEEESFGP